MKILELFKLDKESRKNAEIERKGKQLRRQQEALIDDLDRQKDELEAKKSNLLNLDVDTDVTNWNKDYQKVIVDLAIIDEKIRQAKETQEELFADEKAEKKA